MTSFTPCTDVFVAFRTSFTHSAIPVMIYYENMHTFFSVFVVKFEEIPNFILVSIVILGQISHIALV